jgi:hypothetical protein
MQARHPGLVVVDGRSSGYSHTRFIDPGHLNEHGAIALSAELADVLGRDRGGSRWVALPPYRDHATSARVVRFDQVTVVARYEEARRLR